MFTFFKFNAIIIIVIIISKNTDNYITMTLSENTTITDARYFMQLRNKETNVYTYVLLGADVTTDSTRFNQFKLSEKQASDPYSSEVTLTTGQYAYNVYELTQEQAGTINFNTIDTTLFNAVESDQQLRVEYSAVQNSIYTGKASTNEVYEG